MAFSTYDGFSTAFYAQLLLILLASLMVRVCVSMWGHSGEGKPPMFGDFEAQRHWMEITVNLPAEEWYVDTPYNDLQYWGLDYPPLTAYHMMINGKVARYVNSSMVDLKTSYGMEGPQVKFFMRATVLLMDMLLFLPAAAAYFMIQQTSKEEETDTLTSILVLVGYPGLLLIDNGHFQYNNVSLALLVLATLALTQKYDLLASLVFCLALNYKQMELYHALPFFAYLLGSCLKMSTGKGIYQLFMLSLVVIITFTTVWSPFLYSEETAKAVLHRLFPIKRGLFEDKVANFWCSMSVLIKFKEIFDQHQMAFICLAVTSICLLPMFFHLLMNPTIHNFHYASINSSLIFFLFSFHVHEKSILLAAVPACFVIKWDPMAVVWFLLISVFSMLPLLLKDGLLIPTIVTVFIFWQAVSHFLVPTKGVPLFVQGQFQMSMLVAVCLSIATVFIPPPARYPDIFPMLIAIYSCGHYILFAIYFHIRQFGLTKAFKTLFDKDKLEDTGEPVPTSRGVTDKGATSSGVTTRSQTLHNRRTEVKHRKS